MRKILLILIMFSFVSSFGSKPINDIKRNRLHARTSLSTDMYFIWRSDTIDFSSFTSTGYGVVTYSEDLTTFHDDLLSTDNFMKIADNGNEFILGSFDYLDSLLSLSGAFKIASNETPTGDIDGVNDTYYTKHSFNDSTTMVFLNGLCQNLGVNYVESNDSTIVFKPDFLPQMDDLLWLFYEYTE